MRVRIVAFASAAEAIGGGGREVELSPGATVDDLRARLEADHPALAPLWPRLAVAVDGRLVGAAAALADGAEVALLPPVSGGSGGAARRAALVDGPIDARATIATVTAPSRGAVVTFAGTVRDHHHGRPVARLVYDAYRPMAEAALGRIVAELEAAHRDLRAAIVHRLGEVAAGEASVLIAVAAPHRAAAFEAAREALERLKCEVPIWKREHYADGGAAWREDEPLRDPLSATPAALPRDASR